MNKDVSVSSATSFVTSFMQKLFVAQKVSNRVKGMLAQVNWTRIQLEEKVLIRRLRRQQKRCNPNERKPFSPFHHRHFFVWGHLLAPRTSYSSRAVSLIDRTVVCIKIKSVKFIVIWPYQIIIGSNLI